MIIGESVDNGLSQKGRGEALASARAFRDVLSRPNEKQHRAAQTAQILQAELQCCTSLIVPPVFVTRKLVERFFGELDKKSYQHYADVWQSDPDDVEHAQHSAESCLSVARRTMEVVTEAAKEKEGHIIVLVSHGDVCQILQAALAATSPGLHRSLPHMQTAELREVIPAESIEKLASRLD